MAREYGLPVAMRRIAFDPIGDTQALRRFDNVTGIGASASPTGAYVFEIPVGFGAHMQVHEFVGYHYASTKGGYRVRVSFYSYNVGPAVINAAVTYDSGIPGDATMRPQVRIGRRIATGNPVIIFNDIATATWSYPRLYLASSWVSLSASTETMMEAIPAPVLVTDLSPYDLIVTPTNTSPDANIATTYVTLATAQTINAQKIFASPAIGTTPMIVRGFSGQTATLQEWQTSGSVAVASVSQSGFAAFNGLNVNGAGLSYAAQIAHTTDVINLFIKANAAQATTRKLFEIQDNNAASMFSTTKDGLTTVTQVATGTVPLRVQGIASPTVNIFEVLSSTAYGYFAVSNLGVTTVGNTLSVVGLSAANIPLTVKGQPSQTGDLTQWLNSGNTVLSRIDSDGRWVVTTPVPAGGDSAGPTTFIVRAYTGQFYRNVFRVEQDNGTEITNVGAGQQTWFNLTGMGGGSLSVTYDFWSKPSGANVSVRAGVETQSAFRAVRDVTSPFLRVAEFGSRDFGALTDTVNAYITMAGDATFRTATVTNGTVSGNLALTTKQYVDNLVGAVPVYAAKPVVRAATNGENITNLASAPSPTTIDGYAMQNADRILLKDQSTASQNGVYIWDSTGLARAGDQDTVAEIAAAVITVERGTVNGKSMWMNTNNVAGTTLGATAITYKPLLEVAIQAGPTAPTNAQDLWVDTADTAVPLGITPGPWTTLPLLAGLQAYSVNQTPQYRINGEYTELRGWVATVSGAVSAIASWPNVITLPAEARCVRDFVTYSSAHSNAGAGTIGNVARLETRKSDGMIYFSVAASYPTFSWFSLDGWSFVRS